MPESELLPGPMLGAIFRTAKYMGVVADGGGEATADLLLERGVDEESLELFDLIRKNAPGPEASP